MTRRPRWRVAILTGVLAAVVAVAPLAAQAPAIDTRTDAVKGVSLFMRIKEAYATAVTLRNQFTKRLQAGISMADQAISLREEMEAQATGELGTLGGQVTDWHQFANACRVQGNGRSVCTSLDHLNQRFDSVLAAPWTPLRDSAFARETSVLTAMDRLTGLPLTEGSANTQNAIGANALRHLGLLRPALAHQEEQAEAVGTAAAQLNATVDSFTAHEAVDSTGRPVPISSGRAQQVTAWVSYTEALNELEVAYAKATRLQTNAAETMGDLRARRLARANTLQGTTW